MLWTKVKTFQNLGIDLRFDGPMPHLDAMKVVDEDRARRLSKRRAHDSEGMTVNNSCLELIRMCGWASDVNRKERELAGKGPAYGLQASYLYDEPRLSRLRPDSFAMGGPLPNSTLRYVSLPYIASSPNFEREFKATKGSDIYEAHCMRLQEGSCESTPVPQPSPVSHDHHKPALLTAASIDMSARYLLFDRTSGMCRSSADDESPWRRTSEKVDTFKAPCATSDQPVRPTHIWTWKGRKVLM